MITDRFAEPPKHCACGAPADWLSLYADPCCWRHPPHYDHTVAAEMRLRGWPVTADAYRRTFVHTRREAA